MSMKMLTLEGNVGIIALEQRDEGPAVHLMIRMPANPPLHNTRCFEQVWRADLFPQGPHQHWFGPRGEHEALLTPTEAADKFAWCLRQLRDIPRILSQAGYSEVVQKLTHTGKVASGEDFRLEVSKSGLEQIQGWLQHLEKGRIPA